MTNFTINFLIHIDRRYLALLTFQIVSNGKEVNDFRLSSSCIIQTRFHLRNHFIGLFCSVFVSSLLSLRMRPILNNFFLSLTMLNNVNINLKLEDIVSITLFLIMILFPSYFVASHRIFFFYFKLDVFSKYIYKNISAESKSCFVSFNLR